MTADVLAPPSPIKSSPRKTSSSGLLDMILQRATEHYAKRNWLGACDYLSIATGVAPDDPELHAALGSVRFELKRYREAAASFAMCTQLQPLDVNYHIQLAMCQSALGDLAQAEDTLGMALALRPWHPTALKLLADCYRDWGRFADAGVIYGKLIDRHPNPAVILLSLATCFFATGDYEGTRAALEHVLAADPKNTLAMENMATLDEVLAMRQTAEAGAPATATSP